GINTRIDVFNFYVSANLYYAFGYKVYDNWAYYLSSDGQFNLFFGQYESQANHWQEPGDIADNPKIIYGGNKNSNSASSRFLYRGDHLRLRTLNIGYQIPTKYLENIGLKSATVYFMGENLWTHNFDKDLKYDPAIKASGFTDLNAAPLRSVTFGIKANF
ncbi:MAG TPA: hypothetical protein VJ964_15365, partial [Balneolaceae bacterium]|nr:hypothetical protein [Balneolaceae bacterium]